MPLCTQHGVRSVFIVYSLKFSCRYFRKPTDGSVVFKIGHQGAVLAILKLVLNRVDANGFVLGGWGFNNIQTA
jgi:hypothetical protein